MRGAGEHSAAFCAGASGYTPLEPCQAYRCWCSPDALGILLLLLAAFCMYRYASKQSKDIISIDVYDSFQQIKAEIQHLITAYLSWLDLCWSLSVTVAMWSSLQSDCFQNDFSHFCYKEPLQQGYLMELLQSTVLASAWSCCQKCRIPLPYKLSPLYKSLEQ